MQAHIINLLLLITSIVGIIIAAVVYGADRKSVLNLYLALALIAGALWGGSIFFVVLTKIFFIGNIAFFSVALMAGFIVMLLLSFNESIVSDQKRWRKSALLVLVPAFTAGCVSLYDHLMILQVNITDYALQVVKPGSGLLPFYGVIFAYFITIVILAIKTFRLKLSLSRRLQFIYVVVGMLVAIIMGIVFDAVLPILKVYNYNTLGPVAMILMSAAMAYAATKHYLFRPSVVFSELIAYSLILFSVVWLLTSYGTFNLIFFIAVVSVCILFIRSVVSEAENTLAVEKQRNQLERDKEQLKEMDKMKDEFVMMTTHELNTPISAIRGTLAMIFDEDKGKFSGEQKGLLSPLLVCSKRLVRLFRQVILVMNIDQSRLSPTKTEVVLNDEIPTIIEDYCHDEGTKIESIKFSASADKVILSLDQNHFSDALRNLIDNGIKFGGGKTVTVNLKKEDDKVIIEVIDQGAGLTKEDAGHVFDKFFQAGRFDKKQPTEQQGAGLGLYITQAEVELNGGKISLDSEVGKGSIFSIIFGNK